MKHSFFIRMSLVAAGMWSILPGCTSDPEPQVLQLVSGSNYVAGNRRLVGGKSIITAVYARAVSADAPLSKLRITFGFDSTNVTPVGQDLVFLDSTLAPNTTEFTLPVNYTPRNLGGKEHWRFIAQDSKGKEYSQQVRFTTTSANNDKSAFYRFTNVILSRMKTRKTAQDSLGLAAFSSIDGTGFPGYALRQPEISQRHDFALNKEISNKPSISSAKPNSFYLTKLSSANFDAINTVAALKETFLVPGVSKLDKLTAGQVIAYKTAADKVGLLRVNTVYRSLDSLAFDVKVEK